MALCWTERVIPKFVKASAAVLVLAWYSKQEVPEVSGSQFPQIQPNFGEFRRPRKDNWLLHDLNHMQAREWEEVWFQGI